MKYKNVFVTMVMILFCFGSSLGLSHFIAFGEGDHHNNGNNGKHGGDGDMHGDMSKTGIRGVVSSISGSTISIFNIDIDASTAEVMLIHCSDSLSVDDVVVGDIIEAKGTMNDGSFVASMIKLEGAGKLEGIVEAIDSDTITLLGKEIDITAVRCIKGEPSVGKKARVYVRNSDSGLIALVVKATGTGMMDSHTNAH